VHLTLHELCIASVLFAPALLLLVLFLSLNVRVLLECRHEFTLLILSFDSQLLVLLHLLLKEGADLTSLSLTCLFLHLFLHFPLFRPFHRRLEVLKLLPLLLRTVVCNHLVAHDGEPLLDLVHPSLILGLPLRLLLQSLTVGFFEQFKQLLLLPLVVFDLDLFLFLVFLNRDEGFISGRLFLAFLLLLLLADFAPDPLKLAFFFEPPAFLLGRALLDGIGDGLVAHDFLLTKLFPEFPFLFVFLFDQLPFVV